MKQISMRTTFKVLLNKNAGNFTGMFSKHYYARMDCATIGFTLISFFFIRDFLFVVQNSFKGSQYSRSFKVLKRWDCVSYLIFRVYNPVYVQFSEGIIKVMLDDSWLLTIFFFFNK